MPAGQLSRVRSRADRLAVVMSKSSHSGQRLRVGREGTNDGERIAAPRRGAQRTHFHAASLGSIALCVGLWIRGKTVDQDERGNAERRALFMGLWPPMFWLMGDSLKDAE